MNQTAEATATINPSAVSAQEMFATILEQRIQDGTLEIAISKQVDVLIDSVAKKTFGEYSELSKALSEKFTKAIMPRLDKIEDLPTYHEFVINRLKLAVQNFYDQRLAEVLDAELKQILTEVPEKITLSWLVKSLIDEAQSWDSSGDNITLRIEDQSTPGFLMIYLDKNGNTSPHNCEFRLYLSQDRKSNTWEIISLRVGGNEAGKHLSIGKLYNTEKTLFNVYAMKGRIELDHGLDPDDYDTELRCHDD